MTNPQQSVSNQVINEQFKIETLTFDNYGIDRSYDLTFSIGCTFPCMSCDTQQTKCTSCFNLNAQTPLFLYESSCNVECPVGTYPDVQNVCQPCDRLCKRCSKRPDVCDSCLQTLGFPYVTPQGTCTAKCTNGTFLQASSQSCEACEGSCTTCNSAIECLSCKQGFYFIEGQCLSECPKNSIKFDSVEVQECLKCQDPCATCSGQVDQCTSCSPSTFLYNSNCVNECPATYLPDQNNVCYKASQQTYPFISLIATGLVILIILISLCVTRQTAGFTIFLALESVVMVGFWTYMLAFLIMDNHRASASLVAIAIFANYIFNYQWYEFYNDKLIKNDKSFQQYCNKFPKSARTIKIFSLLTSFQLFRLSYSCLFNSDALKAEMLLRDKHYKSINRYSLFQVTFVYVLTIIASAYNLFYTWYGRQIFWIDIENIIVSSLMIIYHLVVIFSSEKEYIKKVLNIEDKYAPSNQNQVMSVNEDDQWLDPKALKVANNLEEQGVQTTRWMIQDLNNEQRMLAVKAVFHKLITGNRLGEGKVQNIDDKYLLKHGKSEQELKNLSPVKLNQYKTHQIQNKKNLSDYEEVNLDTMQMTYNNNDKTDDDAAPLQTILVQQEEDMDNSVRMFNEKELANFQSAPLNALSALNGNKELEIRHNKLMDELKATKKNKSKNLKGKNKDQKSQQSSQHLRSQTLASQFLLDMQPDSDDQVENFTSEKWGPGASKVVAEHFNTIQAKNKLEIPKQNVKNEKMPWSLADKSTIPSGNIKDQRLTEREFVAKLEEVKKAQIAKRLAKEKAFEFSESSKKLDTQLGQQKSENQKLRDFIKALEMQIAGEEGRLNGVKQTKKEEIEFAENAFYTSNEDGMGVSPNAFISQNRMPKPSHRAKSPAIQTSIMPVNEQFILQNQSNDDLQGVSGRVSGGPLSDANNPIKQKSSKSKTTSKQTGSKSISASEIKAMMAIKPEDSMSTTQKNFFKSKDMRITDGKVESSSDGSIPRKIKSSPDSNGPHRRNHSRSRSRSKVASVASKVELKFAGSGEDIMKGLSGSINYQESSGQDANAIVTSSGDQNQKDPNQSSGKRKGSKKRRLKKSKRLKSLGLAANTDSEAANVILTSSDKIKKRGRTKSNGRSGTESSRNQDAIRSKKSLAMITEGSVTRKQKRNSSNQSGLKPATQKSGIKLVGDLIASGRDTQSSKELRHKPLYNENDNFEFYTSEDEFGARVNKLRKKDSKPKLQSTFNIKGVKNTNPNEEEDLELYSSFDNQGRRVQKLKKKDGSIKKNISQNLGGSQRQFTQHFLRSNSNFNIQEEQKQVNNFNFRPQFSQEQSTIKGSVMGASGENFTRFSMVSSRGNLTSANDQVQQKQQTRSRSNNAPGPIFNQSTIRVPALEANNASQSQITTHRAATVEREPQMRAQASSALRDAGISVIKIGDSKTKKIQRKKVSAPQRDFSGPYFNHTNFEKAVIATNGRAPYNNKEVEIISKQEKFDPKEFNFKNNWVEAMLNDTKTGHSAPSPAPRPRRVHQDDMASASVTATTVFQGINMNQSSSLQQTIEKPKFGQSQTQQNFNFAGSPVAPRLNPDRNGTELKQISLGMSPNMNGLFPDNVQQIQAVESSGDANARTGSLMYEQAQNYLIRNPSRDLTPPKQKDN